MWWMLGETRELKIITLSNGKNHAVWCVGPVHVVLHAAAQSSSLTSVQLTFTELYWFVSNSFISFQLPKLTLIRGKLGQFISRLYLKMTMEFFFVCACRVVGQHMGFGASRLSAVLVFLDILVLTGGAIMPGRLLLMEGPYLRAIRGKSQLRYSP